MSDNAKPTPGELYAKMTTFLRDCVGFLAINNNGDIGRFDDLYDEDTTGPTIGAGADLPEEEEQFFFYLRNNAATIAEYLRELEAAKEKVAALEQIKEEQWQELIALRKAYAYLRAETGQDGWRPGVV